METIEFLRMCLASFAATGNNCVSSKNNMPFNILNFLVSPIFTDWTNRQQVLNSVQFGLTSLLTFLIPLLVILFEKRDEFNSLDKKLIEKISKIRLIFLAIIIFVLITVFSSEIYVWTAIVYLITSGFLVYRTVEIINFILNRDKYRQREILNSTDEETLDYFEEFFLGGNSKSSNGISSRSYLKVFSKEQLMISLFVQNLDKKISHFPKLKPEETDFINKMLDTLSSGLNNIDISNLTEYKSNKMDISLFENLLKWHLKVWKLRNKLRGDKNDQRWMIVESHLNGLIQDIHKLGEKLGVEIVQKLLDLNAQKTKQEREDGYRIIFFTIKKALKKGGA